MKLTLDSSEPLEDAIRVVGSLYGVTLTVSQVLETDARSISSEATAASDSGPETRKSRRPSPKASRTAAAGARAGRSARKSRRDSNSNSNTDIRAWARENGFKVSDRGRVPAAVMTAYRDAHAS